MVQTVEDSCVDHTRSGRILGSLYVIVAHVTLNNSKENIHFLGYIFLKTAIMVNNKNISLGTIDFLTFPVGDLMCSDQY